MQASNDTNLLKLLLVFMVGLLFMSMMMAYHFLQMSLQYERFFGANLLDPYNIEVYPSEANTELTTVSNVGKRVVFLGDSRALEWPAPTYEDARWQFVNRGISAQTSVQVVGRFEHHIAPLNPDIVVIQVGVNDLRLIPMFPRERADIIAKTKESIDQMVADSTRAGAQVILTTIFPVGKPDLEQKLLGETPQIITAVREVNQYILSLESHNVKVLNADPLLSLPNGIARLAYRDDFLHINQHGYSVLNKELMQILMTLEGQYGDQQASR